MIRFEPLIPLWATAVLLGPLLIACLALLITRPRQRWSWTRRLLIVALPLLAAAAGFGTGHVFWSVVFIAAGAFLFQVLILAPAIHHRDDGER